MLNDNPLHAFSVVFPRPPLTDEDIKDELDGHSPGVADGNRVAKANEMLGVCPESAKPRECCRSGACCEYILLSMSPAMIAREYGNWVNQCTTLGQAPIRDIHLLYPMLAGRCRGKLVKEGKELRFVYGPCKNLGHVMENGERKAFCTIHAIRPGMCSRYPYYSEVREVVNHLAETSVNPGYMKGCGYNQDPDFGVSAEDMQDLTPLTLDEMDLRFVDKDESLYVLPILQ